MTTPAVSTARCSTRPSVNLLTQPFSPNGFGRWWAGKNSSPKFWKFSAEHFSNKAVAAIERQKPKTKPGFLPEPPGTREPETKLQRAIHQLVGCPLEFFVLEYVH